MTPKYCTLLRLHDNFSDARAGIAQAADRQILVKDGQITKDILIVHSDEVIALTLPQPNR